MSPTRFVILAAPRTGSNWLCTLLNSHPDILCHHEVFNPNGIFYALDYRAGGLSLGTIAQRDGQPLQFLNQIWSHPLGCNCIGFKMTRGQDERVLGAVLDDAQVRKIVLRRRNGLRTYVSEMIAKETGRWEVYDPSEIEINPSRVHVDRAELLAHISLNETYYDQIEKTLDRDRQKFLTVWYEELSSTQIHSSLLAFLSLSPANLRAKSVKQNPGSLSQMIANYRELKRTLIGSEFEELLEEEGRGCVNGRAWPTNA